MDKLTDAQKKALDFIRTSLGSSGTAPTLREVCEFMGYSAIGSAQDIIAALRKKGFLAVPERQAARSLILTDKGRVFSDDNLAEDEKYYGTSGICVVPCLGTVPAGDPLEAVEARIGTLCIYEGVLSRPKPNRRKLFAVRAQGQSMIGAGIFDGDWLIVASQKEADLGSVVIARIEDDVTCKRLMRDKGHGWYLKPENTNFSNIYASSSQFEIVGKVVALQRSF